MMRKRDSVQKEAHRRSQNEAKVLVEERGAVIAAKAKATINIVLLSSLRILVFETSGTQSFPGQRRRITIITSRSLFWGRPGDRLLKKACTRDFALGLTHKPKLKRSLFLKCALSPDYAIRVSQLLWVLLSPVLTIQCSSVSGNLAFTKSQGNFCDS